MGISAYKSISIIFLIDAIKSTKHKKWNEIGLLWLYISSGQSLTTVKKKKRNKKQQKKKGHGYYSLTCNKKKPFSKIWTNKVFLPLTYGNIREIFNFIIVSYTHLIKKNRLSRGVSLTKRLGVSNRYSNVPEMTGHC